MSKEIKIQIPENLPYNPHRESLYTWQELENIDLEIYKHFSKSKFDASMEEALAQRLHDYYIDEYVKDLLELKADGMTGKKVVGIMGGHAVPRGDEFYVKVALIAKKLTEKDFFIVSGGGPGMMEAANLGAYFGGKTDQQLLDAIEILKTSPTYNDKGFNERALEVLEKHPNGKESLAIPTWFYGHEPSNLFAPYIAKYFSNSLREDILLSIALYGIIYAPGSAGTVQEIFADAAQNYYGSLNFISPMAFLGVKHYKEKYMIYDLVEQLSEGRKYNNMIEISDSVDKIANFIEQNPPILAK